MRKDEKNLIVGLDIGTSKVVAMVAEITPEGRLGETACWAMAEPG